MVASDEPTGLPLTVAAVARRLGVAPATLRTWHRRYGLGPTEHVAGADRRYSAADLDRLQVMRQLVLQGVTPGEAARAALAAEQPSTGPLRIEPRGRGGPGGRVLALPGAVGVVLGLGRAAMALDGPALIALMSDAVQEHGVLEAWDHVLRPVLAAVGQRWQQSGDGVEVEHLLSDCITTVLRGVPISTRVAPGVRPVLLACGPGEQHALPLYALSAALAERGIEARTLGPDLPDQALQAAVRRTAPALLLVWAQQAADCGPLLALPVTRPPTVLVVGGPGWNAAVLPPRITLATDLAHALELVNHAVGLG